ncbi:Uncharacterised protein [Kluyvera cryocrescens]|uniref:Uncharacterized protein n=1 Tax=Kluyvera cryocrescens TaxID=580 RepID=A0A485ARN1_KLUCR|nr:Uncharacterised protein [Kluyvera cryocrescens]
MESVLPADVPISGKSSAESANAGVIWPSASVAIRDANSVFFQLPEHNLYPVMWDVPVLTYSVPLRSVKSRSASVSICFLVENDNCMIVG